MSVIYNMQFAWELLLLITCIRQSQAHALSSEEVKECPADTVDWLYKLLPVICHQGCGKLILTTTVWTVEGH